MEEPEFNINEKPQEEKAEVPPEVLAELNALVDSVESKAKPNEIDQTAEEAELVRTEAKAEEKPIIEEPKAAEQKRRSAGRRKKTETATPDAIRSMEDILEKSQVDQTETEAEAQEIKEAEKKAEYKMNEWKEKSDEERQLEEKGFATRDKRRVTEEGTRPEVKVEKEKSEKELLIEKLDASRNNCAEALYQKDKMGSELDKKIGFFKRIFMGETKKADLRAANEDFQKIEANYKKSQETFKGTLKEHRVYLLKEKEAELNKLMSDGKLKKEDYDKELEKYAKQVAIETTAKESIKLFDLREAKRMEEMGDIRKWLAEKTSGIAEWYRKQPTKVKIAVSAGLFAGGVAGGLVGGVPGAIVLSAAFAGRTGMRVLGGMAMTAGVERGIKIRQERKAEKEITKEKDLADNFLNALREKNDKLDDKLFDLLGRKGGQKRNRYVVSGVAGGLVGSGALAYAFQEAMHQIPDSIREPIVQKMGGAKDWLFEKVGVGARPISGPSEMPHGKGDISGPLEGKVQATLESLQIGTRGPEGVIIDHLRAHPDLAKSWGWDGKTPINQFAGSKAHLMWQNFADAEIAKPEVQSKLAELGYTQDMEGYSEMMRRIGKGFVELDPKGSMRLTDAAFLEAAEVPAGEQYLGVTPERFPSGPGGGEVSMGDVLPDKEQVPIGQGPDEGLLRMEQTANQEQIPTGQGPDEGLLRTEQITEPEARAMETGKNYVVDMPPSPEEIAKNFVSGEDSENLLRNRAGIDKLLTPDNLPDNSALEAISERVDKAIAGTINMNADAYKDIKTMNLEKFLATKPSTLARHLEWRPARGVIDEYLKNNRFLDPEKYDLKNTTVGEFFKKIIKIDVSQEISNLPKISAKETIESMVATPEIKPTIAGTKIEELITEPNAPQEPTAMVEKPAVAAAEKLPVVEAEKLPQIKAGRTLEAIDIEQLPISQKMDILTGSIKNGEITVNDFEKYYTNKLNIPPLSEELRKNLNDNFEAIKGADPKKRLMAERAMRVILQRLESVGGVKSAFEGGSIKTK